MKSIWLVLLGERVDFVNLLDDLIINGLIDWSPHRHIL